jgi:phosphatidylglycerophosphatase A
MKPSQLLRNPIHFLAFGFASGLAPKAPGTAGTLVAIPLVWLAQQAGNWGYLALTLLVVIAGIGICSYSAKAMDEHDSPAIVWDEIAGYMVAFIGLSWSWQNILAAFVLFRLFDISKPGPIGWCDRNLQGGLGIMADDVLAGVATGLIIQLGYVALNLLY